MGAKITILIADRNPNVRRFLKREMVSENYRVICAEDAKAMFLLAFEQFMVDVLIIDPYLPDMEASEVLGRLGKQSLVLPVIVHCLPGENEMLSMPDSALFIEKGGRSIETIKRVLREKIVGRIV